MTLSDVARATDLPKPSVRRALYTLTCLGMAASDGRTFRLTPQHHGAGVGLSRLEHGLDHRPAGLRAPRRSHRAVVLRRRPRRPRHRDDRPFPARPARRAGADHRAAPSGLQHRGRPRHPEPAARRGARRLARQARAQGHDRLHRHRQKGAARRRSCTSASRATPSPPRSCAAATMPSPCRCNATTAARSPRCASRSGSRIPRSARSPNVPGRLREEPKRCSRSFCSGSDEWRDERDCRSAHDSLAR